MNVDPNKDNQSLPSNSGSDKRQTVYKKGKKITPQKIDSFYDQSVHHGSIAEKRFLDRSISSSSDEAYYSDLYQETDHDSSYDSAPMYSDESFVSEDEAYIHHYCKKSECIISDPSVHNKKLESTHLYWNKAFARELKDIATIESREITLDDYYSLNQEKIDSNNQKSSEERINKLLLQTSVDDLPIYDKDDIQDFLDDINQNKLPSKSRGQKQPELPDIVYFSKNKENKLLQYCNYHGITSITDDVYLQFEQQVKLDLMGDRQTAVQRFKKEKFQEKLKQLSNKLVSSGRRFLSKHKQEKLFQYCIFHGIRKITDKDFLKFDRQYTPDFMKDRQTAVRSISEEKFQAKLDQINQKLAKSIRSTHAAKAYQQSSGQQMLENGLLAGAIGGGIISGASVATASVLQPDHDPEKFDHITPKDVPISDIKIFAAHNVEAMVGKGSLPFLATNQSMNLEDMLDKTPIRGFDLDLHYHNGEVVINHGGVFDSTVSDDSIPKLDEVLDTMNDWLDEPENQDEVLFLNFENRGKLPPDALEDAFGDDAILGFKEYNEMVSDLGRAPTIEEIRAEGFKVVDFDHNRFFEAGSGETGFSNMVIDSVWEDRTILENGKDADLEVGEFSTEDIAPHITTEQIDQMMETPGGQWISLDQVSANDPRFFKPEDRDELALHPDLKLMGLFYNSDEDFQSALLGFGTATAGATAALALAGSAYQGFLNEKKIRHQDKLMPAHLKAMELSEILQKRKKSKKHKDRPLDEKITLEEVKSLYKKKQIKTITKDTLMSGASATVSLSGSALALGMIFPPLMPAFGGVSAGIAGTGTVATIAATAGNRKRLGQAVDEAFEDPGISKALQKRVDAMNKEIEQCQKSGDDVDELLSRMVSDREQGQRLLTASTVFLGSSLVARASGMSKYGMPALGTAAMGVGASITGVLVALSATMNYRNRHSKLKNLSQTTTEVLRPDYGRKQKRKLGLFGDTAFQRFLKKNRTEVMRDLGLKQGCTNKEISFAFALPANEIKLEYYLRRFAQKEWLKDLSAFANKQIPRQNFDEVRKDPKALKNLLKRYAVKRVGDFAHNDTFSEGRSGTLKLTLIGAFCGIFFLPMLGVAAGVLGVGLGVSKTVAVHERDVFSKKLMDLMENDPGEDQEKIAAHNSINALIDSWTDMLADTS